MAQCALFTKGYLIDYVREYYLKGEIINSIKQGGDYPRGWSVVFNALMRYSPNKC